MLTRATKSHVCLRSISLERNNNKNLISKSCPNTAYRNAGKGYLACMLHDCHPQASRLVLVDKDSFSHIADRSLRHTELQRIRLDIADFDARGIPGIDPGDAWVAFGKHLCGAATDFTLRCCERHHHRSRSGGFLNDGVVSQQRAAHAVADKGRPHPHQNQKEQGEIPIDGRHTTALKGSCDPPLLGLALATCCHHRCEWHSYVGKEVLYDVGFSARECELMCWMSGWALCGHEAQTPCGEGVSENDVVDEDHQGGRESVDMDTQAERDAGGGGGCGGCGCGCVAPERTNCDGEQRRQDAFYKPWRTHYTYSRKDRMCIGRACKRILDYGREEWLRRCGFEVASLLYVHPEWSGENRLILARCQGGAARIGSKSEEHVRG
jgi:tRNA:m4X modification enzyme